MTNSAHKFLFDEDFSEHHADTGRGNHDYTSKRSEERIADLEKKFEEGREHGIALAKASIESDSLAALCTIRDAMILVSQSMDRELARIEAESIRMVATLARLYADALIDRDPTPMIADAIRKCATMANNTPHLTISISSNSSDKIRDVISSAATEAGYRGQISIREDKELTRGDIRVEWPEGGFLRDQTRIDAVIRTMLEIQFSQDKIAKDTADEPS
jgi:flagellar assembly protein FliH